MHARNNVRAALLRVSAVYVCVRLCVSTWDIIFLLEDIKFSARYAIIELHVKKQKKKRQW